MLKFIGSGNAFNTELGNNSAYIKHENKLFMIDCGSTTFDRMRKLNLLNGIDEIYVLLTHLHPDHVGSLGDLIFYSYYSMGKLGEPCLTVLSPEDLAVSSLLNRMGVTTAHYNLDEFNCYKYIEKDDFKIFIDAKKVPHVDELSSYGYIFEYDNSSYYYSGDSNEIFGNVLSNLRKGMFDYFYQDTCKADYEGNVHLSLRKLTELIKPELRRKVYCMHLDEGFDAEEAKSLEFNVVVNEIEGGSFDED